MNNFYQSILTSLGFVDFKNPVALWWIFLVSASLVNILFWSWTKVYLYKDHSLLRFHPFKFTQKNMIWFSSLYVFGCAYRSIFPKADVQRICLFDHWFSSVFLGRTVATIAELSFVIQWAIILKFLGEITSDDLLKKISKMIVPIIIVAEIFSWFAVISTNYIGNSVEESLWALTYSLILIALVSLRQSFRPGPFRYAINLAIVLDFIYVMFMVLVDVPMYISRFIEDGKSGKIYLGFWEGLIDLNTRWHVTYQISDWKTEIPWMTLYFSFAVLVSISLCYVPLTKDRLSKHLK